MKSRVLKFYTGFTIVLALVSFLLWLWGGAETHLDFVLAAPSWRHPFGTDSLGRDLLVRVLQGHFLTWSVGLVAAIVALVIGSGLGCFAGYKKGWVDLLLMRLMEIISSVPQLVFVTLLVLFFRPWAETSSLARVFFLALAIALVHWMTFARLTRTLVLQISAEPFVEGARAVGAGPVRIFWVHLRPHISPLLKQGFLAALPSFLLFEGFLSFLGFGLQPPDVSLGTLLQEGWKSFSVAPHLLLAPGLVLFVTLFYFQIAFSARDEAQGHLGARSVKREDLA
jgi:ABC-type dipeptide/oligopeptide/nickel transport system permease subunit